MGRDSSSMWDRWDMSGTDMVWRNVLVTLW